MPHSSNQIGRYAGLCAVIWSLAGCAPRRIPPPTVEDLLQDRVTLDGIMIKCGEDPAKLRDTQDCENARVAVERLASQNVDPTVEKRRQEEFERAREQLRLAHEKQRQEQEARAQVDVYSLPVMPVNPPPAVDGVYGVGRVDGVERVDGAGPPSLAETAASPEHP